MFDGLLSATFVVIINIHANMQLKLLIRRLPLLSDITAVLIIKYVKSQGQRVMAWLSYYLVNFIRFWLSWSE